MSGEKDRKSGKTVKILAVVMALAAAFGMGILAYHEFNRNILEPYRSISAGNDARESGAGERAEDGLKEKTEVAAEENAEKKAASDGQNDEKEIPSKEEEGAQVRESDSSREGEQASAGESSFIGEEAAKALALANAGVTESDVSRLSCHVDYDDGRAKYYEVDFWVGDTEYEYEIDLYTGDILKTGMESKARERSGESQGQAVGESGEYIGEEAAWKAALAHAGVEEAAATGRKVKLDREDGRMVYEIEFDVDRKEYEYEIDAVSGDILKAEVDQDH